MSEIKFISGGVCAPKGFKAAGVHCGVRKNKDKKDLSIIASETICTAAAVYTTNKVYGAPITVTREHLKNGKAQAVICNSGNANTCNADGVEKAEMMAKLAADALGIAAEDVVVASTGVIGQVLDIEPIASFEERTVTMIYRRDEEAWLHEEDPELRFYTLWTRKESITKADGRGHLLAPKTFSLLPLEQQPHDIRGEAWYTKTIQWNGYVISVASRKPIGELNIIELQPESLLPEEEAKPDWGGQEEFYFGD